MVTKNYLFLITSFFLSCFTRMDANIAPVYLPPEVAGFESSFPYITGDTLRCHCDHVFDITTDQAPQRKGNLMISSGNLPFDPAAVQTGDTVYVMFYFLEHFFTTIHPRITNPYILVTHNSDHDFPTKQFAKYLDDPNIISWFAPDTDRLHPKLKPMPIGLSNKGYWCGNTKTFDTAIQQYAGKIKKQKLLYLNFSKDTDTERTSVYNLFSQQSFCTVKKDLPLATYLHDLAEHKFVLSPRGSGIDCHRTWEALLMKCYPIVKTSNIDELFKDLPVVIVQDWNEVTQDFLEKKYLELNSRTDYAWEKLYMPYWINELNRAKAFYHTHATKQETHSIAFVHLGPQFPPYLMDALKQARLFNQCPIYLFGNQATLETFVDKDNLNITFVPVENLVKSESHEQFIKFSKVDREFRNNYFFYVCERHLWIHDFMEQYNKRNVFQFETDVMIYVDLATLLPIFEQNYNGIAIAFKSDNAAVPGIYYVKDSTSIKAFSGYIADTAAKGDNDMVLLAEFGQKYGSDMLDSLPIIMESYPNEHELISPAGDVAKNPKLYTKLIDQFKSIFDGDAIGMYLGGEDPRNWWVGSWDLGPGRISPYSVVNASLLHYTWELDDQGRGVPYAHFNDERYRINLIHVHSKKLHLFLSQGGKDNPAHLTNLLSL